VLAQGPTLIAILTFLGTVVVAAGGYAGVRYGRSGSIKQSDSVTLWAQNQSEKDEMRADIKELRASEDACKEELREVKTRLEILEGRLSE
jgi:hypothetical protein